MSDVLLEVEGLRTELRLGGRVAQAVRGVSFVVHRGEAVGIVGESGCGKSMTALSLMRLVPQPPARITGGSVRFQDQELLSLPSRQMRQVRGRGMAMIFQDPFTSLNPTMTLGAQVMEAAAAHTPVTRREAYQRALELLRAVHIPSPEARMHQYPHQVSGGQRQRVMIAMAFAGNPSLLIADEPTTALDVTVQAQIMSLMDSFRKRTGAAVLLITHDLGVVAQMVDRVLVMYAGEIVETGPAHRIFASPLHPYTAGLLASLPRLDGPKPHRLPFIPGQPPDMAALPQGCAFAPRCPRAMEICRIREPADIAPGDGRTVRCHLYSEQ
ncbi:MAG: ABC transporter ATP-binding protein [Chthonomonadales bacterium]